MPRDSAEQVQSEMPVLPAAPVAVATGRHSAKRLSQRQSVRQQNIAQLVRKMSQMSDARRRLVARKFMNSAKLSC
jgi:hypothetical protein